MRFGNTLRILRQSRMKTQKDVADSVEMDRGYYSRLENDRFSSLPTRETVLKIAGVLELNRAETDELLAAAGRLPEDLERALLERADLRALVRKRAAA